MPNEDASNNREGDGSSTLGGCRLVVRHNNQLIVGGSNRMDDGEDVRLGWSVWGGLFSYFGAANWMTQKIIKIKYDEGLRWPPFNIFTHNNQPKTCRRDGGGMG
jgi:hypothetical protein